MKTVDEARDEFRKLMRAYAGFQMATALVVAAKAQDVEGAAWVVSLLAISVPSTLAYGSLMRFGSGKPSAVVGYCSFFAYVPSVVALSILLWPASHFAAFAFPITSAIWVAYMHRRSRDSGVSHL